MKDYKIKVNKRNKNIFPNTSLLIVYLTVLSHVN
jgi:hypothetical protein